MWQGGTDRGTSFILPHCLASFQNVTAYADSLTGPVIDYTFTPRGSDSNWFGFHKLGDSFVGYIVVSAECTLPNSLMYFT